MRTTPLWIMTVSLTVVFVFFQNCSTPTRVGQSGAEKLEEIKALKAIKRGERPTANLMVMAMGSRDDLLQPEPRGKVPLYSPDVNSRYTEGLLISRKVCSQTLSNKAPVKNVLFEIEISPLETEGRYHFECQSGNLSAVRQPASPDQTVVQLNAPTGFLTVRYPELNNFAAEKSDLFQSDNELRFTTSKLLAQDHCGRKTQDGRVVEAIDFEVSSARGSEGLYRIDCRQTGGNLVAKRRYVR